MGKICIFVLLFFTTSVFSADVNEVEELKTLGNEAFNNKNYDDAIMKYGKALDLGQDAIVFRNRGIAYSFKKDYDLAERDFSLSNNLKGDDAKTYYWLGKINLENNKLSRAIYFFKESNRLKADKNTLGLLEKASARFAEKVKKYEILIKKSIDKNDFHKNAETLKIKNHKELNTLLLRRVPRHHEIALLLEDHWHQRNFVPINRIEHPKRLAKLLGEGHRVATVIVQTLPIHLSASFENVAIYDISNPQIEFHNSMVNSIKEKHLEGFKQKSIKDFLSWTKIWTKISSEDLQGNVHNVFADVYDDIKNVNLVNNITTEIKDIFSAVNDEGEVIHDAVFLSTIPSIALEQWPANYAHIRTWVKNGKTVVYTLSTPIVCYNDLLIEFANSFDDVAKPEFVMFDETPSIVHVKLSPL